MTNLILGGLEFRILLSNQIIDVRWKFIASNAFFVVKRPHMLNIKIYLPRNSLNNVLYRHDNMIILSVVLAKAKRINIKYTISDLPLSCYTQNF